MEHMDGVVMDMKTGEIRETRLYVHTQHVEGVTKPVLAVSIGSYDTDIQFTFKMNDLRNATAKKR